MQHLVQIKMDNGYATFSLDKDGQWTMDMQHLVQIKIDNGHATFSIDKDGRWTCKIFVNE